MKRLILASLLICLSLPAFAQEKDEITAESKIRDVTVYSGRAKVTRVAVVEVPAGAHTVVFSGLPAIIFPDSLRAEGSARATVKFGAVSHKQIMSAQLTSDRERELAEKYEAVQDQITLVDAEKTGLESRRGFLSTLGNQAALRSNEDIAEINLKPEQWAGASAAIQTAVAETYKALAAENVKSRALQREAQKIQNELNTLRTDQRSTFSVSVPLESDKATELTIELSYQIPNAGWTPLYDARLTTADKGDLKLIQFGAVAQQTGEDWTGVNLTLSTAQPQRGTSLPDLTPMWVDAYEQGRAISFDGGGATRFRDMSSNMAPSMKAQELVMDSVEGYGGAAPAAAPVPEPKKAEFVAAQINSGGFVTEYKITGPATVPADGTESKLMVGAFDTASKLEIHVKPQLSTDAYLVSKLLLKGDSPILPGQVNLFRDGAYVGQTAIKLLRPDEEYGLYFGVDDQVSVKRKTLKDERQEQGVIARDSVLERQYVTEVQNLHTTPIDLVVKETVPQPQNEKVKVEISGEATTQGYVADSNNIKGLLQWSMKVEPKAKQDVKLGWKLSWPKDYTLNGLR